MSVLGINKPLTIAEVLQRLGRSLRTRVASGNAVSAAASPNNFATASNKPDPADDSVIVPVMKGGEEHRLYALLIIAGVPHKQACAEAGVKIRTAENWRTELREAVSLHLGRDVEYHFAARYVLDDGLRNFYDSLTP